MSISARIERVLGLSPPVAVYVAIMSAAAASTAALLAESGVGIGSKAGVAGLTAVAVFGERGRITLRPKMTVSISLLPAIFAAVLYGPLAAMIVFGAPYRLRGESHTSRRGRLRVPLPPVSLEPWHM